MATTNATHLYRHWQRGTFLLAVLGGAGLALVAVGLASRESLLAVWIGLLLLFLAFLFHGLGVEVDEAQIVIWFGPGWLRKRFGLEVIERASAVTNRWWMGWGIRYIGRGWMWNVSGLRAVELQFRDGSVFRVGSDVPEELSQVIEARRVNRRA